LKGNGSDITEILSWNLPEESKEYHENLHSRQSVSGQRCEASTSLITSVEKQVEGYRYANPLGNIILVWLLDLIFSSVKTLLDVAYPC
jgi:hypothetical protein